MPELGEKPVRFIQGEEILAWLKDAKAQTYRYKGNVPGFYILANRRHCYRCRSVPTWRSRRGSPVRSRPALFGLMLLFGLWCWFIIVHWGLFALRSYVGVGEDRAAHRSGIEGVHHPQRAAEQEDDRCRCDAAHQVHVRVLPLQRRPPRAEGPPGGTLRLHGQPAPLHGCHPRAPDRPTKTTTGTNDPRRGACLAWPSGSIACPNPGTRR